MESLLDYYRALWRKRAKSPVLHSSSIWDIRANDWIGEQSKDVDASADRRVKFTTDSLRSRGLLRDTDSVIDVGCGAGLFTLEFAKHVKRAVGLDYSKRFMDFATEQANARGLTNSEFMVEDFYKLDVDATGLAGAFDLVFASVTPASSGEGCLEKLMRMSRAYCHSTSIVSKRNSLYERVAYDVFYEKHQSRFEGDGFYALTNLLWVEGYYPELSYYYENKTDAPEPTNELAINAAAACGRYDDKSVGRVRRYLERQGTIERIVEYDYGLVLWDTRIRHARY